tara:strand:+ start:14800 stop:14958 length:159 start_codon:yes stop_codon:yes gene_type:complete
MKEKIVSIVNRSWFKAALAGAVATLLLFDKDIFYAGIGYGYAIREFFLAFKK